MGCDDHRRTIPLRDEQDNANDLVQTRFSSFRSGFPYGRANLLIVHRVSDLAAVGNPPTPKPERSPWACWQTAQSRSSPSKSYEAPCIAEVLHLSVIAGSRLPDLQRGEGLWRVRQRAFAVRHLVTDGELQLLNRVARMLNMEITRGRNDGYRP